MNPNDPINPSVDPQTPPLNSEISSAPPEAPVAPAPQPNTPKSLGKRRPPRWALVGVIVLLIVGGLGAVIYEKSKVPSSTVAPKLNTSPLKGIHVSSTLAAEYGDGGNTDSSTDAKYKALGVLGTLVYSKTDIKNSTVTLITYSLTDVAISQSNPANKPSYDALKKAVSHPAPGSTRHQLRNMTVKGSDGKSYPFACFEVKLAVDDLPQGDTTDTCIMQPDNGKEILTIDVANNIAGVNGQKVLKIFLANTTLKF